MTNFTVKKNKNDYNIVLKNVGSIGSIIDNLNDAQAVCDWLNINNNLAVNLHSFFSYDVSDTDSNLYSILDQHKKVGTPVQSKNVATAIVIYCNNSLKDLITLNKASINKYNFPIPMIGEEPTNEEIKYYMETRGVGYYIAIEELRKTKYKKLI
jgi:hypothetical protein